MAKRSSIRSIVVLMSVMSGCCTCAQAWFVLPPLVFDAQRFAQQVQEIRSELQWIESLVRHLENDAQMLRHLDYSNLGGWSTGLQRVESAVSRIDALGNEPSRMAQHLEQRWPIRWPVGQAGESAAYESTREAWLARERATQADCRALQNGVVAEMPAVESRVDDLIERSNSAEGTTAALQARTQLNGELSGEITKLQTLRLSRAALRSVRVAREQSEAARAVAVREWLMRREGSAPPSEGQGTYAVEPVPEQPILK